MASSINASTSGGGGIITTADSSGNLNIQSGGSTVVAVTSTGATVTGTLAATGAITGSSTVAGSTGILYPLTSGTAVASTSGTSIDFTSIPSWVKRITVMYNGFSTNGISVPIIQLGSGSPTTSGYLGSTSQTSSASVNCANFTTGCALSYSVNSATTQRGAIVCFLISGNTWVIAGVGSWSDNTVTTAASSGVTLGGTLDRVRITTVNGTDTFDAGSINILYE